MLLVRRLVVRVAGRDHHALHAGLHHLGEKLADGLAFHSLEYRSIRGHPEACLDRLANGVQRDFVSALLAYRQIVMLLLAIHVDRKSEVLARLEKVQLLLEQQGVRAHVHVLLAGHQAANDFGDARVHQRFPARNRDRRHAALIHRLEALLRRQFALKNVTGILDLSAAGACQVAAIERLQHEHQRVALAPFQLLLEHVAGDGPHLRRGNRHKPYNTG